ncbi:MAG: short-chain dehydrogenase [Lachnospiraceae bacterium]|nr:short-chain dehydrogenase [Lachnospiraceae bacterium]
MADYEIKRKANIGSSSLILIFIVLCLATFGILSLSNARRETVLSEKNAAAVQAYYQTDSKGTEFFAQAAQSLKAAPADAAAEVVKAEALAVFGSYYNQETGRFSTDIPMEHGQALRVELEPDWDARRCRVCAWNVYQKEDYEIDQSIPVWTGGSINGN